MDNKANVVKQIEDASVDGRKTRQVRGTYQKSDSPKMTAWDGLTAEELARPGGMLLAMLVAEARRRNQRMQELAADLGVTYGYIAQLKNGHRSASNASDEFYTACARYLNIPRLAAMLAGGKISAEDLLESPDEAAHLLPAAIEYIIRDPNIGPFVPGEIFNVSNALKHVFVLLYEAATGRCLLPGRVGADSIVAQHQEVLQKAGVSPR